MDNSPGSGIYPRILREARQEIAEALVFSLASVKVPENWITANAALLLKKDYWDNPANDKSEPCINVREIIGKYFHG